jgi:SAM-dependent methyltransferase
MTRRLVRCIAALALSGATASALALQVVEEVPFITSPDNVTLEMLRIANVGPSDHVLDLGSGDGRIVILAAKRFGATGMGVEIVPDLVQRSNRSAQDAGVAHRVSFREQDLFKTDLSTATVITMYLLQEFNLQLRPAIQALKPGTRIVSHDWDMGEWKPDRTSVVDVPDKKVGLEKKSRVHLWVVPAKVEGLWCGTGLLRGASLKLAQRFQEFDGTLHYRQRTRELKGRIDGSALSSNSSKSGELVLDVNGTQMRIASAGGQLALAKGQAFVRAAPSGCS